MKRLTICLAAALIGLSLHLTASGDPAAAKPASTAIPTPLVFEKTIPLSVHSPDITWRSNTFHLVSLGTIQFQRDKSGRLTADISAQVSTFDKVTYEISGAVFDNEGQLLGTAKTQCPVERIWLGRLLTTGKRLTLDFGDSLDYERATGFLLSVSRQKVLTPDDWQKSQ